MSATLTDRLDSLEETLGHRFADRGLLELAVTHSSFAHENPGIDSNERLEFLGDAVIGLVVGHLLYASHADWEEGDLTRGLHALVDRSALAGLGRELGVGPYLRLGRTERSSGGESKDTILADAVEAILGAMYLDAGIFPVEALVRRHFGASLAEGAPRVERDPKTQFQERVMARYGEFPSYHLVSDSGVDGDSDRFEVESSVCGEPWGRGIGRTKQVAERLAAERALLHLDEEEGLNPADDAEREESSDLEVSSPSDTADAAKRGGRFA